MLLLPKATKRKLEDFTLMSYLVMPLLFSIHLGFKLKFLTDWVYYYFYYPKTIILSCFCWKEEKGMLLIYSRVTTHYILRIVPFLQSINIFSFLFLLQAIILPQKFTDIYWCEHFRHSLNLMIHHNATLGDVL